MKINKILLFAALSLFTLTASVNAQSYKKIDPAFGKGRLDAQLGVGITPTFIGDNAKLITPPLSLSLDYMAGKRISIGAYAAHSVTESNVRIIPDGIPAQWRVSYQEIGVRIGFHYNESEKWDFYGGFNPNIKRTSNEDMLPNMERPNELLGISPVETNFSFGGYVGTRYALKEKISAFAEVGTGASLAKLGIGYRILGK